MHKKHCKIRFYGTVLDTICVTPMFFMHFDVTCSLSINKAESTTSRPTPVREYKCTVLPRHASLHIWSLFIHCILALHHKTVPQSACMHGDNTRIASSCPTSNAFKLLPHGTASCVCFCSAVCRLKLDLEQRLKDAESGYCG